MPLNYSPKFQHYIKDRYKLQDKKKEFIEDKFLINLKNKVTMYI